MNKDWFKKYFNLYHEFLFDHTVYDKLIELKNMIIDTNQKGKKLIFLGNGGSAAISSHVAVDLSKNAKIRAINFNEAGLITCLANDYGYEEWMAKAIEMYGDQGDLIIIISSSGKSLNVIKAARAAKKKGITVVTFTGFEIDNPLKKEGDLNLWLNCRAYNIVEMVHQMWLLSICDVIIGNAEYSPQ